jgi:hypothetical protein
VGADLDLLSQEIFATKGANVTHHRPREDSNRLRILLREIGRNGDLSSKIEDSLLWLARMLPFVMVMLRPILKAACAQSSKACSTTSNLSMITRRI